MKRMRFLVVSLISLMLILSIAACAPNDDDSGKNPDGPVAVTGVSMSVQTLTVAAGGTGTLSATITPSNAADKTVTWSVKDANPANCVTVSGNALTATVTGAATGTAKVVVTTTDGQKTAECTVTVTAPIDVTGVTLDAETAVIFTGGTKQLIPTIAPNNATNKNVIWTVKDVTPVGCVTVSPAGLVTGVAIGTAKVVCTTVDQSKTAECAIEVKPVPLASLSLDTGVMSFILGTGFEDSATLSVIYTPSNAANKAVEWTSDDDDVVEVDENGVVTAKGVGTAVVTVTADEDDKITTECQIRVVDLATLEATTESAPFPITSAADFGIVLQYSNAHYRLTQDIDFKGVTLTRSKAWANSEPGAGKELGTDYFYEDDSFFNGTFDGQGFALKNIVMRHPNVGKTDETDTALATWGTSIFGVIGKTGVVKNLAVINYTATGTGQTTVIAQHNHGIIQDCYFEDIKVSGNNGNYDLQCGNAIITAFNYNTVQRCAIKSATSEAAGTDKVSAFVIRNRTHDIDSETGTEDPAGVMGNVTNCFAVTDGLAAPQMSAYDGGSFAGSVLLTAAQVGAQNFSALGSAWDLTGAFPVLVKAG